MNLNVLPTLHTICTTFNIIYIFIYYMWLQRLDVLLRSIYMYRDLNLLYGQNKQQNILAFIITFICICNMHAV